jgi:hypothetical protein
VLIRTILFALISDLLFCSALTAQDIYRGKKYQFLSFETLPTWTGVATDWDTDHPSVHLYDPVKYKGHAQFISEGLKTGITLKQFKERVRPYQTRKYMPFFLFDLRDRPVALDKKRYDWALRIEDYGYEDTPQQMAETTLKLLDLISEYIGKQTSTGSKGLAVLATDAKVKPNASIAFALNQKGYPYRTMTQLLESAGGKKVQILNSGIGVGYLRYVRADGEDSFRPAAEDIVIYEKLPARVSPVNGIITLQPQTPLSHINLLAKNRGTFNLYAADLKYLPGIASHMGKLVKIECRERQIAISEESEKEAKKFWTSHALRIEIPRPLLTVTHIVDLHTKAPSMQAVEVIGAKAMNYALIQQLYPQYVRPGFAIPLAFYFSTLRRSGADKRIEALLEKKPSMKIDDRDQRLKQIREAILNAALDPPLMEELKTLIKTHFPNTKIRLRSSTNCEDLPQFNGAGLYLSKGFYARDDIKTLDHKILQVYASLWTPGAFEEREYYFMDHARAGMGILINEAFDEEYANGVVLTIPGKNGCAVLINTQWGDHLVTNPENGQIPESLLFETFTSPRHKVQSRSSIRDIFLQENLKGKLNELKNISIHIHEALHAKVNEAGKMKYGVDIEFRLMKENTEYRLYVKQARLLGTVLPE